MAVLAREEKLKSEKNPLRMRAELEAMERAGIDTVSKDDAFRFKWEGLFHSQPHENSFMLRIKTEGGRLDADQLLAVSGLAREFGDPVVSLTTRQGLQIRGIRPPQAASVLRVLDKTGLTAACSGADNIRNITACPVDGLTKQAVLDCRELVSGLKQAVLARDDFKNLPRKFNISVSGCGTYCVHPEIHDLGFVAVRRSRSEPPGFGLYAGGVLGRAPFLARDFGYFIPKDDLFPLTFAIIELFIENGCRTDRHHARMAHLLNDWGLDRFTGAVRERSGRKLDPMKMPLLENGDTGHDHLGLTEQKTPGLFMLGVSVPGGNLSPEQAETLALLAKSHGDGSLSVTHHQNLVFTHVKGSQVVDLSLQLKSLGFRTGSSEFLSGVAACTGKTHCKFGLTETKERSVHIASFLERRFPGLDPLYVHLSGCQNGCGHHQVADIGLLGSTVTVDGKRMEAYDIQVGGGTGPSAALGRTLLQKVPVSHLDEVLEFIVASFLRRRKNGETFQAFCARHSGSQLELLLVPWTGDVAGREPWYNRFARWHLMKSDLYRRTVNQEKAA